MIHRIEVWAKNSKEYLNQGSDRATHHRLSDVISLSHPLQDCIWECHCHTDTDSKSRWRRVKISKGCLVLGSDTATCLKALWCYIPVTPSIRLYLRLPLPHWHWFIEQKNEENFFERLSNSGFRHSHMSKALWCYIPVTPSTRLYLRLPLPHRHWFMEQKNES